ncbi:cohesin domain-containing protein [Ruminococcus flavefaciens]|uniref:Cohesin domain-containing protein n=1 Tax=Ruminococcus flavefaciens TaxID=1265 RepID=A0A315Y2D7_RUMFL|nr:cohesin domain-containing protein [Ruminococcus flavefaciens]PWJ14662.1 cohesin domain-containing protein [Ruminococcus flavefaciens]SSA42692.1 Cohesin domain-containing protein [Ruminococcus flavefaciens]
MRIQRITALFTAAALVFCCLPQRVHAAAALDFEIGRATAEAKAGETVKVPVTAKTNPGYGSGVINVNWDSDALTLTNVEFSAERAPDNGSAEIVSDGSYCLSFGDDYATENFIGTGTFFTLTFEVAASAGAGDYMIFLDQADVIDKDIKRIDVTQTAGVVSLTGDAVNPAALTMEIGSAEAALGEDTEVSVPVKAVQNPGYIVGFADLTWDPEVLTLSKIVYADKVPNAGSAAINNSGWYRIAFGNFTAAKNYAETGDMFTLVFTVNESAAAGVYEIMLGNLQVENFAEASVPATVKSGKITIAEHIATTTSTTSTTTTITTNKTTTTSTTSTTTTTNKPTTTSTTSTTTTTTTNKPTTTSTTSTTTTTTTNKPTTTSTTSTTTTTTTNKTTTSTTSTTTTTTTNKPTTTSTTSTTTTTTTNKTTTTSTTSTTTTTTTNKSTTTSTTSTTTTTTTNKPTTTSTTSTTTTTTTNKTTTTSTTSTTTTTTTTTNKPATTSTTTTTTSSTTTTTTTSNDKTTTTTVTDINETTSTTTSPVTQPDYTLGDVNNDGKINAVDASDVLAYYARISTNQEGGYTEEQKLAADVTHDGSINAVDASNILAYYAYISTTKETPMSMEEYMKKK